MFLDKKFVYKNIVLYFICVSISTGVFCGRVRRIVNGNVVETGKFPIAISVRSIGKSIHMCGGTLISQDYVVTAAHCIEESYGRHDVGKYGVTFQNMIPQDENELNLEELHKINVGVQKIYIHDEYDNRTNFHDIALMKLNESQTSYDIFFNELLPQTSFGLTGQCDVFGYGKTSYFSNDTSYDTLRVGEVSIISAGECEDMLMEFVAPKPGSGMICATGSYSDACLGDSGSPMICSGVLEGIVSYGMGCLGSPGVYTRVAEHVDWIYLILKPDQNI